MIVIKLNNGFLPDIENKDAKTVFSFAEKENILFIGTGAGLFQFNTDKITKENNDTLKYNLFDFQRKRIPYLFF